MNTNKILLAALAGGITYFFLGWLIYGILLADYMAAHGNQCAMRPMEEFVWWAMIVSNLVGSLFLAIIISWSNNASLAGGLKVGALVGILLGISIDLSFYSMSTMFTDMGAVVADVSAYTVMSAIGGAVIGLILGMGKK